MICIRRSPTADTRTCDWSKVSSEKLLASSKSHIDDVRAAMSFFADGCSDAGEAHDFTKLNEHDWFHKDFQTGFKEQGWYEMHKKTERHHLNSPDGAHEDVNLIDVLEHIADCVMAGMARSGSVYDLELPNEVLQTAFQNTVKKLKNQVKVVPDGSN